MRPSRPSGSTPVSLSLIHLSDKVVCVSAAGVSDVMTPEKAFARENICKIYTLTDEQYAFLYGEEKAPEEKRPLFEHYVRRGQKLLRCGYTTGTCAMCIRDSTKAAVDSLNG